jgi:hypothetical protein
MSNNSLEALLGQEHAQLKYLKQEHISLVLSKALSETYKHQPNDPVTFFSRYLLNHCNVQKIHSSVSSNPANLTSPLQNIVDNARVDEMRIAYELDKNKEAEKHVETEKKTADIELRKVNFH